MENRQMEAAIEALLFTMGRSLKLEELSAVFEGDTAGVRQALSNLMERYHEQVHGVDIIELDGAYQMCTKQEMYDYIIKLTHVPKKYTLTDVMLETLSIIAYKQPVTRAEIEQIRGVSCAHAINKLLEYNLVTEAGRLDAPGRPILFATTEDFLRCFGVNSAEHLPSLSPEQVDAFKAAAVQEVETELNV